MPVSRELHGPLRRLADKSGLNRMVPTISSELPTTRTLPSPAARIRDAGTGHLLRNARHPRVAVRWTYLKLASVIQVQKGCMDAQAADPRLCNNPWHNSCAFARRSWCHAASRERSRLWSWPALDGRNLVGRVRVCRNSCLEAKIPRHDRCDNGWCADRPAGRFCSDRESPD